MPRKSKLNNMSGGGEICPAGFFCMQEITFLIIMAIAIVVFVYYLFNNQSSLGFNKDWDDYELEDDDDDEIMEGGGQIVSSPSGKRIRISEDNRDIDNNVKKVVKEIHYYDHTPKHPSRRHYLADKSYERVVNPLLPPERDYEYTYGLYSHRGMGMTQSHVPINIETRGYTGGYQQIGMLYKDDVSDDNKTPGSGTETAILPLYGRPTDTNRNKWNYYTSSDKFNMVKIPISHKNKDCNSEYGCEEIYSDDTVSVPAYNGEFKANIYTYDKPRYIPYL